MSVQKYVISKESNNFTIIPNKVIHGLNYNLELLGFYLYLLSLPPSWTFHKEHLKTTCNVGTKKLERFLSLLSTHNLIKVVQNRDTKGRFTHFDLEIFNGENFKIIELSELSTPCVKNCRTAENGGTDNGSTDLRDYKRNKNIKEKKDRERELSAPIFDFVPNEENELLASDLGVNLVEELASFKERHKGKKTQYEFGRWLKSAKAYIETKKTKVTLQAKQEVASAVPAYGPGHPTWEANREWERKHGSKTTGNNTRGSGVRQVTGYLL